MATLWLRNPDGSEADGLAPLADAVTHTVIIHVDLPGNAKLDVAFSKGAWSALQACVNNPDAQFKAAVSFEQEQEHE